MDGCTVVAPPAPVGTHCTVDQAVFTAIRNAYGAGYRIVAASPGLSTEEQREITQRAPSHESLCDPGPAAHGFAAFHLRSGRVCLFHVQHAGREKTSRGGLQVYTRIFVLSPADYTALGADPLRVMALLPPSAPPAAQPPAHLPTLQLAVPPAPRAAAPPAPLRAGVLALATTVLTQQPVLVTEAPDPPTVLRALWGCLPLARRQVCSVSHGLHFAPARRFDIMLVDRPDARGLHFAAEQGCHVYPWRGVPVTTATPFDSWLAFVARRWATGDAWTVRRLCEQASAPITADILAAAAEWQDAIDAAADAPVGEPLAALHARLNQSRPVAPLLATLYDEFAATLAARQTKP
ncbi:MAG: hypothetical protein IPM18_05335 [Phycisphaerales bacterium]|nr:hypothetical protein [Phycisphaerales bacterium]